MRKKYYINFDKDKMEIFNKAFEEKLREIEDISLEKFQKDC